MRNYKVIQSCMSSSKSDKGYNFSSVLDVGEYTETDIKRIMGNDFITSEIFKRFIECGWIKLYDTKDVTEKVMSSLEKTISQSEQSV